MDPEREGRNIILFYLLKSLHENFAIEPALVARGLVNILKRELPEYSKMLTGHEINIGDYAPEDSWKAVGVIAQGMIKRKIVQDIGRPTDDSTPTKTFMKGIKGCSYTDMAKMSVKAGYKGCIVCLGAFSGGTIVSAAFGRIHTKIEAIYNEETDTCDLYIESSEEE